MKKYGYVRVSTKEQNPERQIIALQEERIPKENIYLDQVSGKDFLRPQYQKLLTELESGDILIIKSIDRLGRNYGEILEQWRNITKEIGANIRVLDMPLLNTDSFTGDLTGIFISDLVLQILAYVAETERSFIKQRQAEGIAVAKANGVKFGCQRMEMPEGFEKCFEMWEKGEISIRKAAGLLNMSHSTFYRRCQDKLGK
ncbi:MAG: recombinase family protein [Coprococcus sp.]|nr:recombinase family protein [Coprococcus sp.]